MPKKPSKRTSKKQSGPKKPQVIKYEGFSDPVWQMVIQSYAGDAYRHINRLGLEQAQRVANACSEVSQEYPLWMREKTGLFKKFELPFLGEKSGPYLIAFQAAFLVWTQKQLVDNPLPDSPLLSAAYDALRLWRLENDKVSGNPSG